MLVYFNKTTEAIVLLKRLYDLEKAIEFICLSFTPFTNNYGYLKKTSDY